MRRTLFIVAFTVAFVDAFAQRDVSSEIVSTPYIAIHYGANMPAGDYADRFGYTNHLGAIFGWKTEMNWILAVDGNFMFGPEVSEENMLQNIMDHQETVTNSAGNPAEIILMQRGFSVNGTLGFIFPFTGHNPNSGVMFLLGAGYMRHKIRIETQEDFVPQIQDEYLQGYDRLTDGFASSQFFGYNFMADKGVFNFYTGIYALQGFTYNRRAIFWDRPDFEVPTDRRLDMQFGVRFGWMIPVYKREVKDFYFN